MTRLRVATFNIAHGRGRDGRVELARTAAALRTLDADVVCLQEVDRHWSERSGWADQAGDLAELTGMQMRFGVTLRRSPPNPAAAMREYGLAVLSRWPLGAARVVPLPGDGERRSLLLVPVEGVTVGCMHLAHHAALARSEQVAAIRAALPAGPVIVAGDVNAGPGAAELTSWTDVLTDVWTAVGRGRGVTFPRRWGGSRLDRILVGGGPEPLSAAVRPGDASDHHPLVAEIRLGGAGGVR